MARHAFPRGRWRSPLARNSSDVSGLTKFLLVVLRVAIGWHLCYEGLTKIDSHLTGKSPFSSEMYLRNSTGPMRGFFRGLVDDFWGTDAMNPAVQSERWRKGVLRACELFDFDENRRRELLEKVDDLTQQATGYFESIDVKKKIADYEQRVQAWMARDEQPMTEFGWEEHRKAQRELDALRRELTTPTESWSAELEEAISSAMQDQPPGRLARIRHWWAGSSRREKVDFATMGILAVAGGLMIVGLFSRLAALGGAFLLAQFYFSMPPWPGLPPNPVMEGNYFIVNKTLIELIALLVLASAPTGIWGGLDALVRGLITRPLFKVGADEVQRDDRYWSY